MSETQPDLREALDTREMERVCAQWADSFSARHNRGPMAYEAARGGYRLGYAAALAQVSALQAEVEAARALNRDLHRRVQKAESFRARHGNIYGVKARWRDRQRRRKAEAERDEAIKDMEAAEAHAYGLDEKLASLSPHGTCACSYDRPGDVCMHHSPALTEALAEVERLQKVEGERGRLERVPSAPSYPAEPEPRCVSALRATITSRGPRWHDQTILRSEATRGNCMQAAVASILGLPMRDVPHFAALPDRAAHLGLINFAASYGFDLVRDDCHKHFEGFYLGCGPTARGTHHMVVMRDGEVFHDPHPSRAGLHSVEFVYTFLPLDPATHVAACEAVKSIPPLLAKASEGPWSAESLDTEDGWGPCRSSEIQDAAGKTVLDALNSGVACMAEEADEDGRIRYDEQGAADTAYVVALDGFARRLVSSAPCSRPPKGEDPQGLSAEQARAVTGAARQAPSDNPLTETKEGSEHV